MFKKIFISLMLAVSFSMTASATDWSELIGKAAVPAAFSAQNAENASHIEPLRALWRYENL